MSTFPYTAAPVVVDGVNNPWQPLWMGKSNTGLFSARRNQQSFGPYKIGSKFYQILNQSQLDPNARPTIEASADGVTWSAQDQANAPVMNVAIFPGLAPYVFGSDIFVLFQQALNGLCIAKFSTVSNTWVSVTAPAPGTDNPFGADNGFTYDMIVVADGHYVIVYSVQAGAVFTLHKNVYSGGVWSVSGTIAVTVINPVMVGFSVNPDTNVAYVFYTNRLAFGAYLVPNPLKVITVDSTGAVGAEKTVDPDAVNTSHGAGSQFTYPQIDSCVFLGSKIIATFPFESGASPGIWFPAYYVFDGIAWSGPTLISASFADGMRMGASTSTLALRVGSTAYLFWLASNTDGLAGADIVQIKFVTTMDGVTFSMATLVYDAIAFPPPNFGLPSGGNNTLLLNVGLFVSSDNLFMFAFTYEDTVSGEPTRAYFMVGTSSSPFEWKTSGYRWPVVLPLPDPRLLCRHGETMQCQKLDAKHPMMRSKNVFFLRNR